MAAMPDPAQTIDDYLASWSCQDSEHRQALLQASLADDCELTGPTGTFRGLEAIDGLIVALQTRLAGVVITRLGTVDASDGAGTTFGWQVTAADGSALLSGTDEVELADDGRLRRIRVAL